MQTSLSRREENRLARRKAILDVARDVFLDRGYAATSMSEIACMLGGSKGTLWAHFPSKETLFAAVVEDAVSAFHATMEDVFSAGLTQRQTLESFASKFVAKLTSPAALRLHRVITGEAERFPELGMIFYDRGPQQVLDRLGLYLTAEMQAGRMREADTLSAARQLVGMLHLPQQLLLWNAPLSLDDEGTARHIHAVVDTFLRAYAPDSQIR
jgi:AcrR family transcriptional regulator